MTGGVEIMRWGKMAVLGLAVLVGLGLGVVVAQPWDGPTVVDALELEDEARRDDDASDDEVRDDDDDGSEPRSREGDRNAAVATDDGRDGTPDGDTNGGDTNGGRGTGTRNTGAGTEAISGGAPTAGGVGASTAGSDASVGSASGGGTT
jgi:hypothetical protein